jgi:hypothetical protein
LKKYRPPGLSSRLNELFPGWNRTGRPRFFQWPSARQGPYATDARLDNPDFVCASRKNSSKNTVGVHLHHAGKSTDWLVLLRGKEELSVLPVTPAWIHAGVTIWLCFHYEQ